MRTLVCSMVFIAVLALRVSGQASEKDRWLEDFDLAATRFEKNFAQLLHTRGVETTQPGRSWVAAHLCPLLGYYPPGAAGLIFYFHEAGTLKIWVLDDNGVEGFARREISVEELVGLEAMLKDSLFVESLQASRAPRRRGEAPVLRRTAVPRDLEESIRIATEVLLPPAVGRAISTKRHLIVVHVLNIGTIPFAILKPFGDGTFLVDRMSLSIAPSLSDVTVSLDRNAARFHESRRAAFTFDNPLIVGNPLFPQESEWALPQLPGAELEARSVAQAVGGGGPLVGGSATESRVLSGIGDADFLYFATHGVASAIEPLDRSFLAFASGDGKSGFLTAREIQQTKLRADIAVLSACQTGLGNVHDAGIIGLSRAFQLAGVPHVIMSLWSVYDDATRELMELFIGELKAGGDFFPAGALQAAMRRLREKRQDPAEWACFVVFGIPY